MNSMEICNFLEIMRYGRKISQEEFLNGVVSHRQYQRYRSGESEISYEKLDLFASKLGIPTKKLIYEFEREKNKQNSQIFYYYNAVVNRDISLAIELKKDLEKRSILDEDRLLYFKHAVSLDDYFSGKISKASVSQQTSDLVNYPAVLKQKFFTGIEVLLMSFLLSVFENDDLKRILKKMTEIIENEEWIMNAENDSTLALIFMRLAKIYGIQKNHEQVLRFCNLGIKYGIENKQYYLFDYFYYFSALAHFKMQNYIKFEEALFRCYNVLHFEGNLKKIEKFTKLIEEDFHINFDGFVIKFLKKKII